MIFGFGNKRMTVKLSILNTLSYVYFLQNETYGYMDWFKLNRILCSLMTITGKDRKLSFEYWPCLVVGPEYNIHSYFKDRDIIPILIQLFPFLVYVFDQSKCGIFCYIFLTTSRALT